MHRLLDLGVIESDDELDIRNNLYILSHTDIVNRDLVKVSSINFARLKESKKMLAKTSLNLYQNCKDIVKYCYVTIFASNRNQISFKPVTGLGMEVNVEYNLLNEKDMDLSWIEHLGFKDLGEVMDSKSFEGVNVRHTTLPIGR